MSVVRTCCNKELVTSCIYGEDSRYCTNTDCVEYRPIDMSCSGYMNKDFLRNLLKGMEEFSRDEKATSA